jgi:hypothetical protein
MSQPTEWYCFPAYLIWPVGPLRGNKHDKKFENGKLGEFALLRRMSRHFVSFSQLEISCISKVCENVCNIQKL